MLPLRYVPYDDLGETPNVVVDGAAAPSTQLTLSHWPGSPTPPELDADLSAEIALRALDEPERFAGLDAVSNNHFDQDGLASVYALVDPDAARARAAQVVDVARAGDFGTFATRDAARLVFAIAAYEDPGTSPLGAAQLRGDYAQQVATLYSELLPRFTEMLDHPDRCSALWASEDEHLGVSIDAIERGVVGIEEVPALDLAIVTVPKEWATRATHRFTQTWTEAVHPMAVNNATDCFRMLLIQGHRYRVELRYETWVKFVSRKVMPRPDLRVLAELLNNIESDARWTADAPSGLTPQLRVDGESAFAPDVLRRHVEQFLVTATPAWDPFAPSW